MVILMSFVFGCNPSEKGPDYSTWNAVGGNVNGNKYSSLDQITTENVHQLEIAWVYNTGDADYEAHSQIQCNPIIIEGTMFCTSPQLKLIALDAATGDEKWVFTPFQEIEGDKFGHFNLNNNRGWPTGLTGKVKKEFFMQQVIISTPLMQKPVSRIKILVRTVVWIFMKGLVGM